MFMWLAMADTRGPTAVYLVALRLSEVLINLLTVVSTTQAQVMLTRQVVRLRPRIPPPSTMTSLISNASIVRSRALSIE